MPLPLDGSTRLYPLIGDPVTAVRSPELLTRSLRERGINAACVAMTVPDGELDRVMEGLGAVDNVDGVLVTMPHKHSILSHCGTVSDTSRMLGAASVLRRNADRTWHGDTLDGMSFVRALLDNGAELDGATVLLLGAGGAGSAIGVALVSAGVRHLVVHDPASGRSAELVRSLRTLGGSAEDGPADPTGFDVVCNASPVGMQPDDPLPLTPDRLEPGMFVGDVISGHGVTPLISAARTAGCGTSTGDDMVSAVQTVMVDFLVGGGP